MDDVTRDFLIYVGSYLFFTVPLALVFRKAGRMAWGAFVPFYNGLICFEIAEVPLWWFLLLFVPLVNVFVMVKSQWLFSRAFGKGKLFSILFIFFFGIMMWILAFDHSKYQLEVPKRGII